MRSSFRVLLPIFALALGGCVIAPSPVSGRDRAYGLSIEQEVRMGREADRQIVAQFGTYGDSALQAYVRRVGDAVLATSHLRRPDALPEYRYAKFTFRVLDTEAVNAFALPGGFVYVTRGLLAHLDNEAQLAVVLGHEVAHVAARHGSQNALESGLAGIALIGAAILGERMAGAGQEVNDYGGVAAQLLLVRYSRDDERESDRLGVEYATRAGYRAAEGAAFFRSLQRMQARAGWFPAFLSTHPDPGRREETITQLAAEWAAQGHEGARVEADAYRARIDGIVLGQDPRQGFVQGGTFYHPEGGFRFPVPRGWVIEREGRQVRLTPYGAGAAEVEIGARSRHPSAAVAASEFIRENELGGAASARTNMNGFAGARVDATMGRGDRWFSVTGYWMEHGGAVVRFIGVSESAMSQAMNEAVGVMTRGFRTVADERIRSIQPARVALVTAQAAGPFRAQVDARTLPPGMDMEALAILNGVGVDDVIPAGTVLKLPR